MDTKKTMTPKVFVAAVRSFARLSADHVNVLETLYTFVYGYGNQAIPELKADAVEKCLQALFAVRTRGNVARALAKDLVTREIRREPLRFSTEVFLDWMEEFNKQGWDDELWSLIQAFDHQELELPAKQAIAWGMAWLEAGRSMKNGSMLLIRENCITNSELDLGTITFFARRAAKTGDHAVTRLFLLLFYNFRGEKRKTLSPRGIETLSDIVAETALGDDHLFLVSFLLKMVQGHLGPKTFARLVERSDDKLRAHEKLLSYYAKQRRKELKGLLLSPKKI